MRGRDVVSLLLQRPTGRASGSYKQAPFGGMGHLHSGSLGSAVHMVPCMQKTIVNLNLHTLCRWASARPARAATPSTARRGQR